MPTKEDLKKKVIDSVEKRAKEITEILADRKTQVDKKPLPN